MHRDQEQEYGIAKIQAALRMYKLKLKTQQYNICVAALNIKWG
jgi:hypothetical protein